jgi:DNA-binding CsgD family transcriptional regulator
MKRCTRDIEVPGRLAASLALLDPRSRRLVQLWLAGLSRQEIAAAMRIDEAAAAATGIEAVSRLRQLLACG